MVERQEIDQVYMSARVIVGALIIGQLLFAGIAWFLKSGGNAEPLLVPRTISLAWVLVAVGSMFAALFFRRQMASPADRPDVRQAARDRFGTPQAFMARIITMWAPLEGAALFGLVIYFIFNANGALYGALAYTAVASLLFFPRRAWFEALLPD